MQILTDIEDAHLGNTEVERTADTSIVVSHLKKSTKNHANEVDVESFVAGHQTIYIQTWGCSHNSSDSEYMAGLLSKYGFKVVLHGSCTSDDCEIVNKKSKRTIDKEKLEADLWLLNSCTVKNPAEDHFRNMIAEAQKYNKKLVVAGCVPQGQPKAGYLKGVSVIGVQQIDRVVEVVEETLKGHSVQLYGKKREGGKKLGGASLNLPKIRKNPLIEILPINTGCLNACTYCKTKHARGDLGSYPISEIIDRVEQAFGEGCVEIWLTSEDLGAYGRDIGTNLPDLLEEMVHHIPSGCMLRLGMTNPPYILEHLDRISKILKHPRVYSFLHVPVQSGSDNVLGEMRREYTRADFCNVVDTLYREIGPDKVTVATDVICGFPTETDDDFIDTVTLVERFKFKILFNNQFFPRPGTPAAKMERVASSMEVKNRTKRIHEIFHSYEPYGSRIGDEMNVLVTEVSTDDQHFVGHTKTYEQVLLPKTDGLMGHVVRVRVVESTKHSMIAEVIKTDVVDICDDELDANERLLTDDRSRDGALNKLSSPMLPGCSTSIIRRMPSMFANFDISHILAVICISCILFKILTLVTSP